MKTVNYTENILDDVDWEAQWASFGHNFHDGFVHIRMTEFGATNPRRKAIRLQPGPGFGDLSHPTTKLMLLLLSPVAQGKTIVDIGCGSGVLSLCSIAMGASFAYGVDIDPLAIEHSQHNAAINEFSADTRFSLSSGFTWNRGKKELLLLMNMISSEQQEAWASLPQLHAIKGEIIVSGILKEQRSAYLELCYTRGWTLQKEREEGDWIALKLNV